MERFLWKNHKFLLEQPFNLHWSICFRDCPRMSESKKSISMKKRTSIMILLLAALGVAAQCPFNDCTTSSICIRSWCENKPVEDVLVSIRYDGSAAISPISFNIPNLSPVQGAPGCYKLPLDKTISYPPGTRIEALKDDNPLEGVSTFDLIKIARHLRDIEPLPQPYGILAAEINGTTAITSADIVELRKLLLGIYKELPNVNAWRFVNAKYDFQNPANLFDEPFLQGVTLAPDNTPTLYEFVGVKTGDVNCSYAHVTQPGGAEERRAVALTLPDISLAPGQTLEIPLSLGEAGEWFGLQGSLLYDTKNVVIEAVMPGGLRGLDASSWYHLPQKGTFSFVWFDALPQHTAVDAPFVVLRVRALKTIDLREAIRLDPEALNPEAYDAGGNTRALHLNFIEKKSTPGSETQIFAPQPNPTAAGAQMSVHLSEDVPVVLDIFDLSGKNIYHNKVQLDAGIHQIEAPEAIFPHSGVYVWRIQAGEVSRSGKLIRE
jgi:hypothetical protein